MVKRSKLLSVLLSGTMLTTALVGCGSSNETGDGSDNSSSGKDTLVVKWSIGIFDTSIGDYFNINHSTNNFYDNNIIYWLLIVF